MDSYQKRVVKAKSISRSQSSLGNCVIEFNPVQGGPLPRSDTRPATRPHSRQSSSDHDSFGVWTVKDLRNSGVTSGLLSRSKRPSPHELLNTVIGSHIVFSESPSHPGVPLVFRPPEEKLKNPERLNLDRRNLCVCPILEGEERLRLLNLQHNNIQKLENLSSFRRMVFLDLYDNQVAQIAGISELVSLRVLMLGKNRIEKISGLETLGKLDVLDLHGNQISQMHGLENLSHLRVLNLAGNCISVVKHLTALQSLNELNLRRNRIEQVFELDQLLGLQRLFLSHNLIQQWNDIQCLGRSRSIVELSLSSNPFSSHEDTYRLTVLTQMKQVQHLDMVPVSEEEKAALLEIRRSEEDQRQEKVRFAKLKERKHSTIARIQRQWERSHGSSGAESVSLASLKDFVEPVVGVPVPRAHSQSFCDILTSSSSSIASMLHGQDRSRHLRGPSPAPTLSFYEIMDTNLHLYGNRALDVLQSGSFGCPADALRGMTFHFVDFPNVVPFLSKIGGTLPNVKNMEFHNCKLSTYLEVNALAVLPVLNQLTISEEGNPLTKHTQWRNYVIYRLSHLQLAKINEEQVSTAELITSEQAFGGMGQVCSSLLHFRLLDFVKGQKLGKKLSGRKRPVNQEPVSRAALVYPSGVKEQRSSVFSPDHRYLASKVVDDLMGRAVATDSRMKVFEELWPQVFDEFVQDCRLEMLDLSLFMRTGLTLLDS